MKLRFGQHVGLGVLVGLAILGPVAVAQAAPLLAVDVSDRSAADGSTTDSGTQSGYGLYLMGTSGGTGSVTSTAGVTQTVAGYSVNLAPITNTYTKVSDGSAVSGSGIMDDRDRNFSLPAGATTTLTEVYDDFIFNTSNAGGLRLTVSGPELAASTRYVVTIYAYDHGSTGTRTANWVDQNNADAPVLTTTFAGSNAPASNASYRFTGFAMTDANGALSLRGVNMTSLSDGVPTLQGVFINGFEISAVPEPTTAAAAAGLLGLVATRRRSRR